MEPQETTSFIPLISRLDRLDRVLHLLEEKHSLSKCEVESNNECKTLSSALEEVQHKGTLLERLTLLEKRVLELSLKIDEENTSTSSSSTVEVSETIGVTKSGLSIRSRKYDFGIKDNTKDLHQERASFADGFMREKSAHHKSKGHERKYQKNWLWLLRLRC